MSRNEAELFSMNNVFFFSYIYYDFIVNIYTIELGTSFYNLLVPLHTNTLIT
jgi:hypothetical protein